MRDFDMPMAFMGGIPFISSVSGTDAGNIGGMAERGVMRVTGEPGLERFDVPGDQALLRPLIPFSFLATLQA
jgi:hypothetical protein